MAAITSNPSVNRTAQQRRFAPLLGSLRAFGAPAAGYVERWASMAAILRLSARAGIAVMAAMLCVSSAHADSSAVAQAEHAIASILPTGWSIVERKNGEIPWGHHWCDEYKGVTGTKFVARGIYPSKSRFLGRDGQWKDITVGAEALDIWVMPGTYRNRRADWLCIHRPVQPTSVVYTASVKVYARPSHHATPEEKQRFNEQLAISSAVESPESPWNDPGRLSWSSWQSDINVAIIKHSSR